MPHTRYSSLGECQKCSFREKIIVALDFFPLWTNLFRWLHGKRVYIHRVNRNAALHVAKNLFQGFKVYIKCWAFCEILLFYCF